MSKLIGPGVKERDGSVRIQLGGKDRAWRDADVMPEQEHSIKLMYFMMVLTQPPFLPYIYHQL
ncbi:hypothetical protein INR49_008743 [Caranx melampygus]|nr:hypothetical protein INR49_008743 [Caranx melampygus]